MVTSPLPAPTASSAPDRAQAFLQGDPHQRLQILQGMGLARFAPLLIPLSATAANLACMVRVFAAPQRAKFPDLNHADLQGLHLQGANLIRADLRGACLQGCCLWDADLIFADLTGADLRAADLRGATLYRTQWHQAQVEGCQFGSGLGLDPEIRTQLLHQGGIFT